MSDNDTREGRIKHLVGSPWSKGPTREEVLRPINCLILYPADKHSRTVIYAVFCADSHQVDRQGRGDYCIGILSLVKFGRRCPSIS